MELDLGATTGAVAMDATNLAPSKVRARRVLLVVIVLLSIPVVVVVVATVGSTMVPVVGIVVAPVLSCIRSNRKRWRRLRFSRQLELHIDQFLMNLCQGWSRVSSFYLINHGFILFRETSSHTLDHVFEVKWLAEQGKLVKAAGEALKVIIDRFGALSPLFELMTQLKNVSTAWFRVDGGESAPDLSRNRCCRQERLN